MLSERAVTVDVLGKKYRLPASGGGGGRKETTAKHQIPRH